MVTRRFDATSAVTPEPVVEVAASARGPEAPLHIAWVDRDVVLTEAGYTLRAVDGAGRAVRVSGASVSCGEASCFAGTTGTLIGPVASRDGVTLFGLDTVVAPAGCDPAEECSVSDMVVTGGVIRWIRYTSTGVRTTIVPGAPPAAMLATAGRRLAEQPFTARGAPASRMEIRDVQTGGLASSIPVAGTIDAMALSQRVLAVLTANASGYHLVRYDAATGKRMGSSPLAPTLDPHTLAVCGKRIVYQTRGAIRIFHLDLGHATTAHHQRVPRTNLTIDTHGLRWVTRATRHDFSAIRGIEFPGAG